LLLDVSYHCIDKSAVLILMREFKITHKAWYKKGGDTGPVAQSYELYFKL
jgi:hypothetical protein